MATTCADGAVALTAVDPERPRGHTVYECVFFFSSSSSSSLLLFSVSQGKRGLFYLIITHFTNKNKLSLFEKRSHTHTHSCAAACVKFRQRRRLTAKCRRRRLSRFTTANSWFIFITATVLVLVSD